MGGQINYATTVEHDLDNAGEVNKFVTTDVFPQKALIKKH